jgi:hypothetical protein
MSTSLKYVPIFRIRQEESKVLSTFDFGDRIYPCIEIIKDLKAVSNAKKKSIDTKSKADNSFEAFYALLINSIKAKHVFVDLPVHLQTRNRGMNLETLTFLKKIVTVRDRRTEYINRLSSLAPKMIPVIATYSLTTGEKGSIIPQENSIRPNFEVIAFRTFMKSFSRDIEQIEPLLKKTDFVIMDWQDEELDLTDGDQLEIVEHLKKLDCTVITHRNSFPDTITNVGLIHGEIVEAIDNSILNNYKNFGGNCFSDYSGIKKDKISSGAPIISPGFVYYDSVNNEYYGYRYKNGSNKKGAIKPKLEEFETTIVPDVIASEASRRMHASTLDYLGSGNRGWKIITDISRKKEKGKSPAKFKRIGMEHYLHCIKSRIANGDFD